MEKSLENAVQDHNSPQLQSHDLPQDPIESHLSHQGSQESSAEKPDEFEKSQLSPHGSQGSRSFGHQDSQKSHSSRRIWDCVREDDLQSHTREVSLTRLASSASFRSDLEQYQSAIDISDLVIKFNNVNVTMNTPQNSTQSYETFGRKLLGCFMLPIKLFSKKRGVSSVKVLDDISGYIMPGTMTLVLGPRGSGKSTLLKLLAGHLHSSKTLKLEGEVLYNDSVLTRDIETKRPIAYVTDHHNVHLPVFTIRETLEFAEECTRRRRPHALTSQIIRCFAPDLLDKENAFLEYLLEILGLKYIENLPVGIPDESARSRLTTAEIAMRTFSVMLYDQPATAEDWLRLYDRFHNLLHTVVRVQQCAMATSLVHIPPDAFDLFDRIILLNEGQVIYQGPRHCMENYFSKLGFERPNYVDQVVFLQDIATGIGVRYMKPGFPTLTHKELVESYRSSDHFKDITRIVSSKAIRAYWTQIGPDVEFSMQETPAGSCVFVTKISDAEEVATNGAIRVGDEVTAVILPDGGIHYVKCDIETEQRRRARKAIELLSTSKDRLIHVQLERKIYQRESAAGFEVHSNLSNWLWSTRCLLIRQAKFTNRFRILVILRLIQVLVLGLFAGTMFYRKGGKIDQFEMIAVRTIGFVSMVNLLLLSLSQIPVHLMIHRPVFQKQQAEHFFPVSSYVVAHLVLNLPQSFVEAFIYSMCTYFLANLSLENGGAYFEYLVTIFLIAYLGSSFVLLVGGFAPVLESALAIAGLFILVCLLFSGVILIPSVTPDYWKWMLYIAPTRWGNIILSSTQMKGRYKEPCSAHLTFQFCLQYPQDNLETAFLKFYDLQASKGRLALAYGAIILFILATSFLSYLVYKRSHLPSWLPSPPVRKQHTEQALVHTVENETELSQAEKGTVNKQQTGFTTFSLPAKWLVLTFYDVKFQSSDRTLNGVSGYAKPEQMLAILGSTGSGKSTLLKCLAGTPPGKLEGNILVNGVKLNKICFHRISGFAHKVEIHQPYLTVRESLEFSANLRLGRNISPAEKARHVDLVLELTGLSDLSNSLVGSFQHMTVRTRETTKKLSIAIELAANPSILFLDDPTSQLDGSETRNVLKMLKTVTQNKRNIVLTLHHPSWETLNVVDNVLVLAKGQQVYFGSSTNMINYFSSIPNVPSYDGKQSPVLYLLGILGGGFQKREPATEFVSFYQSSALHAQNSAEIEALQVHNYDQELETCEQEKYAAPLTTQVAMVFLRNWRFLWRNVKYTFGRLTGLIIIALVMGTLFLNIDVEASKTFQSASLIMYIQAILVCATTANNVIPQLGTDRQVYLRESRSSMYKPILYPLSWIISEIPYVLLGTLALVGIANGMAGVGVETFTMFIKYWACMFLFTMVVVCWGIFLACAAPLPAIAITISSIFTSIWISSSGVSIPRGHIKFYKWLYWIDPIQYTINILTPTSFFCNTRGPACLSCRIGQPCPGCPCKRLYDAENIIASRSNRTQAVFVWDRLLQTRPIEKGRNEWDYVVLCGMALFFTALAVTSFRWLKHNRA